jgi:hypothetical protein
VKANDKKRRLRTFVLTFAGSRKRFTLRMLSQELERILTLGIFDAGECDSERISSALHDLERARYIARDEAAFAITEDTQGLHSCRLLA